VSVGALLGITGLCLIIGWLLADLYFYIMKGDTFTRWVIRRKKESETFRILILVILFGGAMLLAEHFEVFSNG
jgi:hypothetical protein